MLQGWLYFLETVVCKGTIIIDRFSGDVRLQTICLRIICNVARSEILAGNSFIVRCHVTSKSPMRARSVGKKFPAGEHAHAKAKQHSFKSLSLDQ